MKRGKLALLGILSVLALASCDFAFVINPSSSSSSSSSSQTSDTSKDGSSAQEQSSDTSKGTSSQDQSSSESSPVTKTKLAYTQKAMQEHGLYQLSYAPTLGQANLLVVPVWFTDSTSFIASANREQVRKDIQTAYFGSTDETGWHSVKTFYEAESLGKLSLSGTVTDWYEVGKSYTSFGSEDKGGQATEALVPTVADWYFKNNPTAKRTDFDKDGDGYLDAVMMIYAAPDYSALRNDNYSNLWAYCYWYQDQAQKNVAKPGVDVYFWASYDFMYDSGTALIRTGKSRYATGDCTHCTVDAHTFIHEMGHVFGLEDYYDYGPNSYSHAGAFSMQDHNIGGHDPYSTMVYGWTDPYIPTQSCSITLKPFQSSHDVILLTPSWNSLNSVFDEYLLLELYTPTGLNKLDATYSYANEDRGPTSTGIRLWHIDSRLAYCNSLDREGYPVLSINQLTTDPRKGTYGTLNAFSNTCGDESYGGLNDSYNLLKFIRNNRSAALHSKSAQRNSDLFGNGTTFSLANFSSQFANKTKLNGGKELGWSFSVSIQGSGESATATIDLVKA